MADPFLGEIRSFSSEVVPKGWALCNGQTLPIAQNQALYTLIGTTYGGDGQTNFLLPNLMGCVPMHVGNGFALGASGGQAGVTLTVDQIPAHTHQAVASSNSATVGDPGNAYWASSGDSPYAAQGGASLDPGAIQASGQGQAHQNMAPYLALTFCIALVGIFPPQS